MIRAAIYCRISMDATGERAGVTRQQTDCEALAARRGWDVTDRFIDNDISAYSGRRRPEYRRMLTAMKTGDVDAVVVWHLDRLTRRPVELEEFFEVCDAAGITNLASCTGDTDLSTHDGRFMARILGAVARKESDDKSRRVTRKHLELAEQGKPAGGTRPFGYDDDKITIRPGEAAAIRDAAARVLAGDSLWAITRTWNDTGVKASRGGHWTQTAIRRILTSPRTAGLRALDGTVVGPAVWQPILDEALWRRVRAVLDVRRTDGPRRARTYLLTGLVWCSRCGKRLIGATHGGTSSSHGRTYTCPLNPGKGGCGGIRIVQPATDDYVIRSAIAWLRSPEYLARAGADDDSDDTELIDAIRALEARNEQLARDHYVDRVIGRDQFFAASRGIDAQLGHARRALAAQSRRALVVPTSAPVTVESFGALSLDRQRSMLAEIVDRIDVLPAGPVRGRFDDDRLDIRWR